MLVPYMNMSPSIEYYMKGIDSYFKYMNGHGFMQRYYINGGVVEGCLKRQQHHHIQSYLR